MTKFFSGLLRSKTKKGQGSFSGQEEKNQDILASLEEVTPEHSEKVEAIRESLANSTPDDAIQWAVLGTKDGNAVLSTGTLGKLTEEDVDHFAKRLNKTAGFKCFSGYTDPANPENCSIIAMVPVEKGARLSSALKNNEGSVGGVYTTMKTRMNPPQKRKQDGGSYSPDN